MVQIEFSTVKYNMHSIKGQEHLIIQITYFYCYWAECFTSTFLTDDYPMMHFWRVLIDRWLHWICRPPHWIIMEVRSASPYWHVYTRCVIHFQKGQLFVLIFKSMYVWITQLFRSKCVQRVQWQTSLFDKETLSRSQIPPEAEICQLKAPFDVLFMH